MGVNSLQGQALAGLPMRDAAFTPAPRLRTTEATPAKSSVMLEPPKGKEEQVQRAASSVETVRARPVAARTHYRVDEDSKRIIARIVDENDKLIRQIPPEELLKIAAQFRKVQGILFDETR